MDIKTQEQFIRNCYNNCNGYNMHCGYYKQEVLVHFDKKKSCSVYTTIQNDIKKIKNKQSNITYGLLEEVINNGKKHWKT